MRDAVLVVNAGSSSIKFALYPAPPAGDLQPLSRGELEGIGTTPHLVARGPDGGLLAERRWPTGSAAGVDELVAVLIQWIEDHLAGGDLVAAGHRVAHGGDRYAAPVLVDDAVMAALRELSPLVPLHQPRNLEPIEILARLHPGLPQVACFDTAFHVTVPGTARLYGLPRRLIDAGLRRYGFHGLSYEYIAGRLPELDAAAASGRTVVAHLGSGASMCALVGGRSVATTMGFGPLGGLVMGTRPGELDPGVLLWLMEHRGMDHAGLEHLLYHESGLLGVSGVSSDMRTLLASDDPHAREAIDLFVYRVCRELGSLAAAAGGLDAVVFTGGIGEHAAPVRAEVCRRSAWLGVRLDDVANRRGGPLISTDDSAVRAWVVPTDEELVIARHTGELVRGDVRVRDEPIRDEGDRT